MQGSWAHHLLLGAAAVAVGALLVVPPTSDPTLTTPILVVALAAGAGLLVVERRQPALRRRLVLAACAGVLLLAVVAPVRGSRDLWQYAFYGRSVAVYHESPYTHAPAERPDDPFFSRLNPVWHDRPSVYGPLFTGLSAAVMVVAGSSPLAARLAFQAMAALAVAASLVLVDRRTRDPAAVALVGLHPAVVVYGVGGGHNDALVGLGVLAAVVLMADRRAARAGAVLAGAVLVKVGAVLALLPLAWWAWRHAGRRAAATLIATAGGLSVVGVALAGGRDALEPLRQVAGEVSWSSLWRWWLYRTVEYGDRIETAQRWARPMLTVALVVVAAVVARRVGDARSPALAVAGGLGAWLVAAPYALVWYLLWLLPSLALRWRSATTVIVLAWSAVLLMAAEGEHPSGTGPGWLYVATALTVVALVAVRDRGRYSPPPAAWRRPRARPAPAG